MILNYIKAWKEYINPEFTRNVFPHIKYLYNETVFHAGGLIQIGASDKLSYVPPSLMRMFDEYNDRTYLAYSGVIAYCHGHLSPSFITYPKVNGLYWKFKCLVSMSLNKDANPYSQLLIEKSERCVKEVLEKFHEHDRYLMKGYYSELSI